MTKWLAYVPLVLLCFATDIPFSTAQVRSDSLSVEAMTPEQLAAELANPNTLIGRVTLQLARWSFDDDLPDAAITDGYSVALESSIPFPVNDKAIIRFRPNIPLRLHYPVRTADEIDYRSGLGDITFDLAYGTRSRSGFLIAVGMAATLPTATVTDFGGKRLTLGPEVLVGIRPRWGVLALFPNHEWKISGEGVYNRTIVQPLITLLPGKQWTIGSKPNIAYDWITESWSVPWSLNIGKTSKFSQSAWKFEIVLNYYGNQHVVTALEWMTSLHITRVVATQWAGRK